MRQLPKDRSDPDSKAPGVRADTSMPPTRPGPGPSPRWAARAALLRAVGQALYTPVSVSDYLLNRAVHERAVREALKGLPSAPPEPACEAALVTRLRNALPARPLKIAVACAEASGELHAISVVRHLRRLLEELGAPPPNIVGFGGEALAHEDVTILGDPVARAAMGFEGALSGLPFYLQLVERAAAECQSGLDLFLPIDSPALHVPMGRIARRYGVPVVHFVTPQYWGWAPWRVRSYARAVTRALTILPFEPAWFEQHSIETVHVGHPLLDRLVDTPRGRPDANRNLVVLPGSRAGVIERNLPWMLRALEPLQRTAPELEVQVLQASNAHAPRITELLRSSRVRASLEVGDLHRALGGARAAFSVSGTILIDLLHHRLPAVVVYRLKGRVGRWMYTHLLSTPWFSSPNLLAGEELLPEYCFSGEGPIEAVGVAS